MVRVEFHCHTIYSKDSLTHVEHLLKVCRQRDIGRLVITDHNTIAGAVEAKAMDPDRVIIGEEIQTDAGELLAAYVNEEIPPGLPHLEAIKRLRDQNAFISVSHPFDRFRSGHWELPALQEIAPLVDAIEVFNARCMLPSFNHQALAFARQHQLSGTVGSDAHALPEVGKAVLLLSEFTDSEGLRLALKSAAYRNRLSGPWVHFYSRYASYQKKKHRK
jgi:predicted metal-dependent phosphoesterase TrpH